MADGSEEFSELRDADIDSVHAVGKAANGTRILFAKQAAGGDGVFEAEFVRGLIAKGEIGTAAAEDVRLTPAQAMALVHAASVRKARNGEPAEAVAKEKYSADDRKRMAANGQAMDDGSYPIADAEDLDNAVHAVGRGDAPHDAIRRHIARRAKALGRADMLPDTWGADGQMQKAGDEPRQQAPEDAAVTKAQPAPTPSAAPATPTTQENTVSTTTEGVQPGAATVDTAAVAKGGALSEAELAELGRAFLAKQAAKAGRVAKGGGKKKKASGAAAPDGARIIPGTDTVQSPAQGTDDVMKAQATQMVAVLGEAMAPLAKQLGELAGVVKGQGERVDKLMSQPDDRRSPLLNGAIGEPSLAQRGDGPTTTPEFRAVLKAVDEIPDELAREQARKSVALAAIKARFAQQ